MARLEQRLKKLEQIVSPNPFAGKQSLQISVNEGETCDVVLQRELDKSGITLSEVRCLTIIGGIHTRPMRDFQNHPEWTLLQKLNKSKNIFWMVIVQDKKEWAEYQEYQRNEQSIN